ncbi:MULTISPECIES: ribbon-helix-helix domain-containing protein [unclassified Methylobacterium]|uniref:ribbon-helix-helix domain-containing protein n=1 Tax=unclassified Methylobacterium TaxID=2615210 RepID=UPI001FBBB8F0|nr:MULTISPECIES: ribbon-helix-helix domain-containing protein [unclassified Methylobacterium]MCJ2091137.1 hypothetical protein [Methylobacterium sp. J-072]MCJ2139523.1 hypothetical protein [Methylobacterium sp. E-066]
MTDSVSTGRRDEPSAVVEPEDVPEAAPVQVPAVPRSIKNTKTKRPATRQGARGITVWVEPEVYRMIKLVGLDTDMTTQDVMMEAINDLLAKRGKGRLMKTR